MSRSIQEWAHDAYDHVQSACNLSGIVFAFEQCVEALVCEAKRLDLGETWVDEHPISVCFSDKFDDLSRSRKFSVMPCDEHLAQLMPQFAARMRQLCKESHRLGYGTDWRNEHASAQEFVRKIVSVTRSRGVRIFEAFERCEQIVKGETPGLPKGCGMQIIPSSDHGRTE